MIGGQTIARIILADTVTILFDLPNGEMVIMKRVVRSYPHTIAHFCRKTGVRIIGIEGTHRSIVSPDSKEILTEGEDIIAIGNNEQLKKFIRLL
jgi:Trk K+ transport system NAD-binding subunit